MPSARRSSQLAIVALGAVLLASGLGGCSTTQEKAAAHQAESERILKAREKRQQVRRNDKHHADGPKKALYRSKSARRQEGD